MIFFRKLQRLFLALLVPALFSGCGGGGAGEGEGAGSESVAAGPSAWAGCYTLAPQAEGWRVPAAVALDTASLEGWEAFSRRHEGRVYRARSFQSLEGSPGDSPFAYWRPLGTGDSVSLGHPGALAGMTLRMTRREGAIKGTLLTFTDALTPGESGRDSTTARVERVPCDSLGGPPSR